MAGYLRPAHDFHGGTRAPEAQIRVGFGLEEQPSEKARERVGRMPDANKDTVIGLSHLEPRTMGVQAKEIVWGRVDDIRSGAKTDQNCNAFSAFNGEEIDTNLQSEFNKKYVVLGVTQGGSDPEVVMGGDKSGIAVITQGATTITNLSEYELTYGEFVAAEPPSIDRVERERLQSTLEMGGPENFINGKYLGHLKKVTYEDLQGSLEEVVAYLLGNTASLNIPDQAASVEAGRPGDHGDIANAALNLKRFISWTTFCVEMVTRRRQAEFARLRAQPDYPLVLAKKLGLIDEATVGGAEDDKFQQEIIERALVSSLNATTAMESVAAAIEADLPRGVIATPFFGGATVQDTPAERVLKEGLVAYDLQWRSTGHLLERQNGNLLGQIIGRADPCGPVDINLRAI